MSLRDWFAGQIDPSGVKFEDMESAASFMGERPPSGFVECIALGMRLEAKLRYMAADAMLAARKGDAK